MHRFIPMLVVVGLAACSGTTMAPSQDYNRAWGPNEKMSALGKTSCTRPQPPSGHPARMRWDDMCMDWSR
ncbi:MAG: hypothetical protein ACK5IB_11425 [Qingshengfaniella sp.]